MQGCALMGLQGSRTGELRWGVCGLLWCRMKGTTLGALGEGQAKVGVGPMGPLSA